MYGDLHNRDLGEMLSQTMKESPFNLHVHKANLSFHYIHLKFNIATNPKFCRPIQKATPHQFLATVKPSLYSILLIPQVSYKH